MGPRPTACAIAHLDMEAAHYRTPHDVFLVLRLDPLHLHCAPTPAPPRRQGRLQFFIHLCGHGPEGSLPIFAAAFAARRFGFRLRCPFGKRRGLAMDDTAGFSRSCSNRSMRFWSRLFLKRACSTCRWRFSSSSCFSRSGSFCGGRGACMCKSRIRQARPKVQRFLADMSRPRGVCLTP